MLLQSFSDGGDPGLLIILTVSSFPRKGVSSSLRTSDATSARSASPPRESSLSSRMPLLLPWLSRRSRARSKLVKGAPTSLPGLTTMAVDPYSAQYLRE